MKISILLKRMTIASAMIFPFINANAKLLSPEEALQRAVINPSTIRMSGNSRFDLSYTETIDGKNLVYVFNNTSNGFIIVAGDDRMQALLGYSENGNFSIDKAAPALKWWINTYAADAAQEVTSMVTGNSSTKKSTRADKVQISPLISTNWGQAHPFNDDCPQIKTSNCVTGCVATAMSQVIKYHAYPDVGIGKHDYEWNDTTLSFNYGESKFDYADMQDKYTAATTEVQDKAVAKLMYACGVGVNMDYSTEESGAVDYYIPYALRSFFGYDNGTKILERYFYSDEEWEDLIYNELDARRPVIFSGQAPRGGHTFIIDGYDGDGYFHVNWGWDGYGDGNFLLNAMNPEFQGVGGYEGGYNSNQSVVCGIQPPVEGSTKWYPIYATGSLEAYGLSKTQVSIKFAPECGMYNFSPETVAFTMYIKVVSEAGEELIAANGSKLEIPGAEGTTSWGYSSFGPLPMPSGLTEGKYKGYLVFKTPEGVMQEVMFPFTATDYFEIEIDSEGNISGSQGDPNAKAEIRVTKFEPTAEVLSGVETKFNITIENIGEVEYNGYIYTKVFRHATDESVAHSTIALNSIAAGNTVSGTVNQTYNLEPGLYDIIFYDIYEEVISDPFSISIGEAGVNELLDEISYADVYSSNGILMKKNANKDYISSLPKGIYVLISNGKTYKVIK